jgi:hypothetical protein
MTVTSFKAAGTVQTTGKSYWARVSCLPGFSACDATGLSPHKIRLPSRFPTQNTNNRNREPYSSHDAKCPTRRFNGEFAGIPQPPIFSTVAFFPLRKKKPAFENLVKRPVPPTVVQTHSGSILIIL